MNSLTAINRSAIVLALVMLLAACNGSGGFPGEASAALPGDTAGRDSLPDHDRDGNSGFALLTWKAPTSRTDGSCLSDLAEYQINYGLSPSHYEYGQALSADELACTDTGETDACGAVKSCTYIVEDLPTASWYFAVRAVDSAGNISEYSNEALKTVQ